MALPAILQMLGGQNAQMPQLGQLRHMIGMIRGASNPQAFLSQMIQQSNPAMTQAMDYIRKHGNDPKAACEALAKEKGISLKDIGL